MSLYEVEEREEKGKKPGNKIKYSSRDHRKVNVESEFQFGKSAIHIVMKRLPCSPAHWIFISGYRDASWPSGRKLRASANTRERMRIHAPAVYVLKTRRASAYNLSHSRAQPRIKGRPFYKPMYMNTRWERVLTRDRLRRGFRNNT